MLHAHNFPFYSSGNTSVCMTGRCAAGICAVTIDTAKVGTECRAREGCHDFVCDAAGQCSAKNVADDTTCQLPGMLIQDNTPTRAPHTHSPTRLHKYDDPDMLVCLINNHIQAETLCARLQSAPQAHACQRLRPRRLAPPAARLRTVASLCAMHRASALQRTSPTIASASSQVSCIICVQVYVCVCVCV